MKACNAYEYYRFHTESLQQIAIKIFSFGIFSLRLSQSPFQYFFFPRFCFAAGKDFSHLQRGKSTVGFFDRGVTGRGCVSNVINNKHIFEIN